MVSHLKNYPTLLGLNYNWSFGSLTGVFLVIQLISGVFLSFHYIAEIDFAFESVEYIMREVNYGWLMRYTHANSASFFFIFMYLHIFRAIFYKSYMKPHHRIWSSGVVILIVSIVVAFIGYVLPWGQMSYWGATVITNLLSAVPLVGLDLVHWIWGGQTINKATLTRFYSLHYLLAIILTVLVLIHLSLLHEVGSSNPIGISLQKDNDPFNRSFGYKDFYAFTVAMIFFVYIVFFEPDLLGHPDNYIKADPLATPAHIVPEWYFSPFYAVLRSVDSKFWGVVCMLLSILILLFLPACHRIIKNSTFIGYTDYEKHLFFYLFSVSIIMLWFVGGLPAEFPFVQYGKFFTAIYFLSYPINFYMARRENRHTMELFHYSLDEITKKKKGLWS
jgi:ubiquinol-cytochrome c reductase cytochrome b subunit